MRSRYPWVFLDDGELSDEFKAATTAAAGGPTRYGRIPASQWSYPEWVPAAAAAAAREQQVCFVQAVCTAAPACWACLCSARTL